DVAVANGMHLLGWSYAGQPGARLGDSLMVRLFWKADRPVSFDYSAFVRLRGPEGQLVHGEDHGPGALIGFPSTRWQLGEVIPDDWSVPLSRSRRSGSYAIEVGVYDYRDLKPALSTAGEPIVVLGTERL
ncbi:MAG: hypothetical protein KGJ86_12790, partial [Chloroflexota bacterium]|nr:hypothetical protein [Chloroflexota bacterium]